MTLKMSRSDRLRQQTETEILDAAFLEFAERGYHQTAIADIAARLGMGHGTFYRYFKNKRDILEKVLEKRMGEIITLLNDENAPDAVDSFQDYVEQIQRIKTRLIDFGQKNHLALKLILLECTSIDEDLTAQVYELVRFSGLICGGYMLNGVKKGFFRADIDCDAMGHAIVSMIVNGALHLLKTSDDPTWIEAYADSVVDLLANGLYA